MKGLFLFAIMSVAFTVPADAEDFKVCLDTGAPISGSQILVDADALAAAGAEYVRINFILGPWTSPDDTTRHDGRTWFETYDKVINSLIDRNIKVYGLIGAQAVKCGHPLNSDDYVKEYARNFTSIVGHFKDRVRVYESFNEPNDWAGGTTSQVQPQFFAKMLQEIFLAVKINNGHRDDPAWQVTLVSGPLFGHDISDGYGDTAAPYLQETYKAGIEQLAWKEIKQKYGAYPLDGVGYHTYVRQGKNTEQAIKDRLNYNLNSIWNVVEEFEGTGSSKKMWISECGWNTCRLSEEEQARNLVLALGVFRDHPNVCFGTWFQICDFGANDMWGLFRSKPYTEVNRKPAWKAFKDFASANRIASGKE